MTRNRFYCLTVSWLFCLVAGCGAPESELPPEYRLMRAVTRGDLVHVAALLANQDIDINWQAKGVGPTPLSLATQAHQMEIVEYLLAHGADPNIPGRDGFAPLHSAAADGHYALVETLLNSGANPNAVFRRHGYTPLAHAVSRKHPGIVKVLLDAGANPFAVIGDGRYIVDLARASGSAEIVAMIEAATRENEPALTTH